MDSIIKGYLGFFLMILIVFLGIILIDAGIETRNADMFIEDAASKIEASNFNSNVISACKSDADANGYTLTFSEINAMQGNLMLEYEYTIPLINIPISENTTLSVVKN